MPHPARYQVKQVRRLHRRLTTDSNRSGICQQALSRRATLGERPFHSPMTVRFESHPARYRKTRATRSGAALDRSRVFAVPTLDESERYDQVP